MKLRAANCLLSLLTVASITDFVAAAERKLKKSSRSGRREQDEAEVTTTTTEDPLAKILPLVTFNCKGRHEGYYADVQFECEVFHYCNGQGLLFTFMCPPTSRFNQKNLICDYDRFGKKSCAKSSEYFHINESIRPKDNNTVTTASSIVTSTTKSPIYESYDSRITKEKDVPTTESTTSWKHDNHRRQKVTEVPSNYYVTQNPREYDAPQDAPYEYDDYEHPMPRHYYDDYETSTESYEENQSEVKEAIEKKKKRKKKKSATIIGTSVQKSTTIVGRSVESHQGDHVTTEQIDFKREKTTTEIPISHHVDGDYTRGSTTNTDKSNLYQDHQDKEMPRRKQVLDYDDHESDAEASEDAAISQSPDEYGSRKERRSEDGKDEVTPSTRRRGHRRERKYQKDTVAESSTNTPVRSLFNRPRPKNKFNLSGARSTTSTESSIPPTDSDNSNPSYTSSPNNQEYTSVGYATEEIATEKPKLPRTRTNNRERKPYASRLSDRPRRKKIRTTTPAPIDYDYKAEVVEIQPTEAPKPRTRTRGRKKLRPRTETTVERPYVYYDDQYESTTQTQFPTTTQVSDISSQQDDPRVINYERGTTPAPNYSYYNVQSSGSEPESVGDSHHEEEKPSRIIKRVKQRKKPQTTTIPPLPASTFVGPLADPFDIPPPTHLFEETTEPPFRPTSPPRQRATIRLNANRYEAYSPAPTTPTPRKKKVLKGHKVTITLSKHLIKPKKKAKGPSKEFFFKPKPDPLPDNSGRIEEERLRKPFDFQREPQAPPRDNQYSQGYRESRYVEPKAPQQYETQSYVPEPSPQPRPEIKPVTTVNYQNSNGFRPILPPPDSQHFRHVNEYGEHSPWYPVPQPQRPNQPASNQLEGIYQNAPVFTISENPDGLYAVPSPNPVSPPQTQQQRPPNYYDYQPQQQFQPNQYQVERPPPNQYQQSGSNEQYQPSRPENYQHRPGRYQDVSQPQEQYHDARQPPEQHHYATQPQEQYQEVRQPQDQYQENRQPQEQYQDVRQPPQEQFVEFRHMNEYRPKYQNSQPSNRPEEERFYESPRDIEDDRKKRLRKYQESRQEGQINYENLRQHVAAQSQEQPGQYQPGYEYENRPETYPSQNAQAFRNEYSPYGEGSEQQPVTDQYVEETSHQTDQQQPEESRQEPSSPKQVETATYETRKIVPQTHEVRYDNTPSTQGVTKPTREQVVFITELNTQREQTPNHQPETMQLESTVRGRPNQVEYDSDKHNYQQQTNINQYEEEIAYPLNNQESNHEPASTYPVYSDSQQVLTSVEHHQNHVLHGAENNHRDAPTIQTIYHANSYPVVTHVNYKNSAKEPDVSDSITSSQYVNKEDPFSKVARVPEHESEKDGTHFDDREQAPFMGSYTYKGPKVVNENTDGKEMFYKEFSGGETMDSMRFESNNFHSHDGFMENAESINRASKKREAIYEPPHHKNFFDFDIDLEEAASGNNKTGNASDPVRRRRQIIFADHIHQAVSPYMGSRPPRIKNPFEQVTRQGQIFMQDNGGRYANNVNSVINARQIPQQQRYEHLPRHPVLHGAQPVRLHNPRGPSPPYHPQFAQQQRTHFQAPHPVVLNSPAPPGHILMGFPLTVPTIRVPHPQHAGQQIVAPPRSQFQDYSRPVQPQGLPPNEDDNRQYQQNDNRQYQRDRPQVQYSEPYVPPQETQSDEGRPSPHQHENRGVVQGRPTVPYYGYGYNPYRRPNNDNHENSNVHGEENSKDSREKEPPSQDYDTRDRPEEFEDDRRGQSGSNSRDPSDQSDSYNNGHPPSGESGSYTINPPSDPSGSYNNRNPSDQSASFNRNPASDQSESYNRNPPSDQSESYNTDPSSDQSDSYNRNHPDQSASYNRNPPSDQSESYNRNPPSDQSESYNRNPPDQSVYYNRNPSSDQSESYNRNPPDQSVYYNRNPSSDQSDSYHNSRNPSDQSESYNRNPTGQSGSLDRDRSQSENVRPDYESEKEEKPANQYDSQEDNRSNQEKPSEEEESDSGNATQTSTLPYPDNVHAHYLKHYNNSDPISNPFDADFFKPPPYYDHIPPYADLSIPKKENETHQMEEKKPNEHGPPFRPPPPPLPPSYYGPYDPSDTNTNQKNETEKRPPFDYQGYTIPPIPDFTVTFPPPSKYSTTTEDPKSASESRKDKASVTEATSDVTNLPSPVMEKINIQEASEEPPTTQHTQPAASTVGFGGRIRPVASKIFPRPTYKPSRNGAASTTESTTTKIPFTYRRAPTTTTTTIAPYANEDQTQQSNKKVFHATGGAMSDKKTRPKFGPSRSRITTTESDLAGGESQIDYVSQEPSAEFLIHNQPDKNSQIKHDQTISYLHKTKAETNEVTTFAPSRTTNYKIGYEFTAAATPSPSSDVSATTRSTKWSEPIVSDVHQYLDQEAGSSPWAIYKEIVSQDSKQFQPTWITDKPYKVDEKFGGAPEVVTVPTLPVHKIFNVSVKWSPKINENPALLSTKTVYKIPSAVETTTPIPTIETARVTSSHITRYTSKTPGTPWRLRIEDLMPETKAQNVADEIKVRPVYNARNRFPSTTQEPYTISPIAAFKFERTTTTEAPATTTSSTTTTTSTSPTTTTENDVTTIFGMPDTTTSKIVTPKTTTSSSVNKKDGRTTTTTTTTENPFPGLDLSQLSLVDNIVADSVVRVVAAHAPPGYLERFDSKRLNIKAM